MKVFIRILNLSGFRYFAILASACNLLLALLHILSTCSLKLNLLSIVTPKSFTLVLLVMISLPIYRYNDEMFMKFRKVHLIIVTDP